MQEGPDSVQDVTRESFVAKYPPQPPAKPHDNDDELRRLTERDGVAQLAGAPADVKAPGAPKKKGDPNCYLWVIDTKGIPHILELAAISPPLASGKVKHSNLTGGEAASAGGELWFDVSGSRIYVNGCSGRYGPRTKQQLEDVVLVLSNLGYEVVSFGWDEDADLPAKVLRQ